MRILDMPYFVYSTVKERIIPSVLTELQKKVSKFSSVIHDFGSILHDSGSRVLSFYKSILKKSGDFIKNRFKPKSQLPENLQFHSQLVNEAAKKLQQNNKEKVDREVRLTLTNASLEIKKNEEKK